MRNLLCFILIVVFGIPCYAGTATRYNTYATGDSVTAANLNGNFDNILTVLNGDIDNTNVNTTGGYRLFETLGALPAAGSQGRVVFLTTDNQLYFDNGSSWASPVTTSGNQSITGTKAFSAIDVNGGAIDGAIIGAASPAAGSFADITGTGTATLNDSSNAVLLNIDNDGTGKSVYITADGVLATSSPGLHVYSNAAQINSDLVTINQDNASSTKGALSIECDSSAIGALSVQTTLGEGIYIGNSGTDDSILDDSGAKLTAAGVWTNAPSFMHTKENIRELNPEGFIEKLKALNLYTYQKKSEVYGSGVMNSLTKEREFSKDKKNPDAPYYMGFILDDPSTPNELIARNVDGTVSGISPEQEVSFLLAVNKELIDKVEELEKRISKLEK